MATAWPDYLGLDAATGNNAGAKIPVSEAVAATPSPGRGGKRLRLDDAASCRREMARTYVAMKSGAIDVSKGSKLIYALTEISRAIEREAVDRLSERLDAMETAK